MRLLAILLFVFLAPAMGWAAAPDERARESLFLRNGDRMTGWSHGVSETGLDWELPHGERVMIPLDEVDRLESGGEIQAAPAPLSGAAPATVAPTATTPSTATAPSVEALSEPPEPLPRWRQALRAMSTDIYDWTKRLSFGGRFVDGNSKEMNIDVAALFEKKSDDRFSQVNAGGQFGQVNGNRGIHRWFANSTTDLTIDDPWILFLNVNDEYNERQNLDYRGTVATGPGLRLYNEEKKRLILRSGPAVTVEFFHKPYDSRVSPDWFSELELRWPLTQSVQFEHRMTVNPSIHDISLVRASSNSAILWALDQEKRWNFRLGMQYQYISQPNLGRQPHDYWTTLQIVYTRK
jgi:putative salt-induced outer membrane protein YdiY